MQETDKSGLYLWGQGWKEDFSLHICIYFLIFELCEYITY